MPRPVKVRLKAVIRPESVAPPVTLPTLAPVEPLPTLPTLVEPVLDADIALRLPYLFAVGIVSEPEAEDLAFPDFAPPLEPPIDLPLPPEDLFTVGEGFLGSGRRDARRMVEAIGAAGLELQPGTRVLDFGCGPGRVLRWLPRHIDGWGIDLDAARIAWCQSALSPPFRFAMCSTFPHVPFADGSFDLVYAGSVFTRLSEQADAWLLELIRITAPGGLLYLTVHDQASIEFCRAKDRTSMSRALTGYPWPEETEERFRELSDRLGNDLQGFTMGRGYLSQVFYDRDAIVRHWGRYAEVVEVIPEAFSVHQTAVVLRRRSDDRTW